MSLLEGFRDSRTGRDGGGGGLPISGTAAPSPDAAAAGATPRETGKNGHDVVFALVLALYCYQQRRRKQGEQGRRGRRVSSAGSRGTDGGTDGDGDGGGERLDAIGRIVGGGEGGVNSRSSQIEASTACSAAAVSVVASGAAAPCDVDPECEAEMLVTELQDARRLHLREVEFYLPQLCMIIGLGDFTHPPALVEFLLDLCQSDLRLAHKIHWFLKSYCSGGGSPDALEGLASFALRVQKRGCAVASRLSKTLARQALVIPASDRGVSRAQAGDGGCKAETEAWKDADGDNGGGFGGDMEAEPATEEKRGFAPSVCRRSERNEGGEAEQEEEEEEEEEDDILAEHYDPAMFFVEALLGLAEQLGSLSAKKRAEGLQEGLERINEFFLSERAQGSDVIYVPFGEGFHQIRAIHPRESMHFSTKERVPLLVCLEVQRVHVPTAIIRSAAKAARATGSAPIPTLGSATVAGGGVGVTELATETDEGMHRGETDHAGEAGLMERFRGTVRSFVKLRSDDGGAHEDNQGRSDEESLQGSTEREDSVLPLVRLGDTIEVDECSSRTASEPDLGNSRGSTSSSGTGGGISISRRPPSAVVAPTAAPAGKLRDFSRVGEGRAKTDVNDSCSENDYEDEDREDVHDRRGVARLDYHDRVDKGGGASSQGGFWYGEGGGAGALEAALGQWGGYLDVTVAADATSGDEEGTGSCDRGVGGDGVTPRVGGGTLARHGDHYPPVAFASVASVAGAGTGAGVGGDTLDPEDDSWEIVDAPEQWEGHSNPSAAAGCGDVGSGSGCGSDSFSEYLAAAEAEQRDSQLAAEAEEEEQAKLKAEVEAETQLASPPGVPPPTKRKGAMGEGATGNAPGAGAAGAKPVGRSYFAPVAGAATAAVKGAVMSAGAAGGVVGRGRRRRRRRPGLAGEPRIVFKEHWREKELRVWQEGRSVVAAAREGASKNAIVRPVTTAQSTQSSGNVPGAAEGIESGGASPLKGWKLLPIIVKANDDLRQEQFVSHLVAVFDQIFSKAELGARLRPYEIMATSPTAGVIEAIPDTVSLDALKRHTHHLALHVFFRRHFGRKGMLRQARANFVGSCAAYSVVCYLLQIKDRHNGNILLSADGHLIHIDWGFALDLSPGGNLRFESAPFKLTQDFVEVMGGARSASFQKYRSLCVRAFLEARRNRQKIITLVEMMMAFRPDLACFGGRPEVVLKHLRARFQPEKSPETCVTFVHELIQQSVDNWRTRLYDTYQRAVVGIQ